MALAANYVVTSPATISTTAYALYTVPSSTSATYAYNRDLVVTNAGPTTLWVGFGAATPAATTAASFEVPTGGSILLTQCQVTSGYIISVIGTATATGCAQVGYASAVSVI